MSAVPALLPPLGGPVPGQVHARPGQRGQADLGPAQGAAHQLQRARVPLTTPVQ